MKTAAIAPSSSVPPQTKRDAISRNAPTMAAAATGNDDRHDTRGLALLGRPIVAIEAAIEPMDQFADHHHRMGPGGA